MSKRFEPIYLQDANRHIQWLYEKIKETSSSQNQKKSNEKESNFFDKVLSWFKKIF